MPIINLVYEAPWPTITTDYAANTYTGVDNNTTYFYWIKFTALKDWEIKKVWMLYDSRATYWTLKIASWLYASTSGTTYSINDQWEYTLPTPYHITAWNDYVVSIKINSWSWYGSYEPATFPITWVAVRYDYWTISAASTQYTSKFWFLKYLEIEYT